MFKALMLEKDEAGFRAVSAPVDEAGLPEGDVGAASSTRRSTTRTASRSPTAGRSCAPGRWSPASTAPAPCWRASHADWKAGDRVVHNGWGVGETRWGASPQRARLKGDWLVELPAAFSTRQAMAIGTAGYTAMLCVLALERHGVDAGRRRGAGDRRDRRRRQRRDRAARAARPAVVASTGKAERGRLPAASSAPPRSSTAPSSRRPASRCRRSAGPAWSTRSAARRWPTRWRRRATAASSPPAAWRRATTCRAR